MLSRSPALFPRRRDVSLINARSRIARIGKKHSGRPVQRKRTLAVDGDAARNTAGNCLVLRSIPQLRDELRLVRCLLDLHHCARCVGVMTPVAVVAAAWLAVGYRWTYAFAWLAMLGAAGTL